MRGERRARGGGCGAEEGEGVQEKGKGSGGSQRKQPLGKERGGWGEGEREERGDTPPPKEF